MKKIGHEDALSYAMMLKSRFGSKLDDGLYIPLGDVKVFMDEHGLGSMELATFFLGTILALLDNRKTPNTNITVGNTSASTDSVNHPSHYNQHERECIVEMYTLFGLKKFITFCKMNAWKYRYRAGSKANNTADKDNAKADRYIEYAARAHDMDYWNIPPHRLTDDEYWKADTVRGTY